MRNSKKMISLLLFTIFIWSTISTATNIPEEKSYDSTQAEDLDPLIDIKVTVEILEIISLERYDLQINAIEKIDLLSNPDFFVKVYINDIEFNSGVIRNTKYLQDFDWSATLNVPDNEEFVNIKIELWDKNIGFDRRCDISNVNFNGADNYINSFDAELVYSIKTGHWWGDDFAYPEALNADPSGYGRLCGCDDGTIYELDRDCELWFNIYQNDYDNDNIPYWTEVNVYGTDPEKCDLGRDDDNDEIPIEWEHKWGHYSYYDWRDDEYRHYWIYDPFIFDDHRNLDPDEDGLNNVEEYLTSQWRSDPFRKDLFIEIDQMEIGPNGEGGFFPEKSKELLRTSFARHNIVLHLDDGSLGGGQKNIPFDENTTQNELKSLYHNFFLNGDENYWRKNVFHYALIVYMASYPGFVFIGDDQADSLQLSTKAHDKIAFRYPIINRLYWLRMDLDTIRAYVYAGAFMHETGHTLGIFHGNTPGCDDQVGKYPYQVHYWKWRPYRSCMNYVYVYRFVDYSDGSRGKNDFNDWGRIDLTRFQRSW